MKRFEVKLQFSTAVAFALSTFASSQLSTRLVSVGKQHGRAMSDKLFASFGAKPPSTSASKPSLSAKGSGSSSSTPKRQLSPQPVPESESAKKAKVATAAAQSQPQAQVPLEPVQDAAAGGKFVATDEFETEGKTEVAGSVGLGGGTAEGLVLSHAVSSTALSLSVKRFANSAPFAPRRSVTKSLSLPTTPTSPSPLTSLPPNPLASTPSSSTLSKKSRSLPSSATSRSSSRRTLRPERRSSQSMLSLSA